MRSTALIDWSTIAAYSEFAAKTRAASACDDTDWQRPLADRATLDADLRARLERVSDPMQCLRQFRQHALLHAIVQDWSGATPTGRVLAFQTDLAEVLISSAFELARQRTTKKYGQLPNGCQLVVIAMGKLGAGSLNFSSDVDLILVFEPQGAAADGPRRLDEQRWYNNLGQDLVALLSERTADGIVYRTDLRLRPYGSASPLATSAAVIEPYYLREGRGWERLSWIRSAAVAGDLALGQAIIQRLQPFVFRRYLDYGALEELRRLHGAMAAERIISQGRDLKHGRGGIRELEFLVQALQLIRGGRSPDLQAPDLAKAIAALGEMGVLSSACAHELLTAWWALRRIENAVQARQDRQEYCLPDDAQAIKKLGQLVPELASLEQHRRTVAREFDRLFALPTPVSSASGHWWQLDAASLAARGAQHASEHADHLQAFANNRRVLGMGVDSRRRLDQLMPLLIEAVHERDGSLPRMLALIEAFTRRTAYLAMLTQHPPLLERVVDLVTRSEWLSRALATQPILLDDLLIDRQPTQPAVVEGEDPEHWLSRVRNWQRSRRFNLAITALQGADPLRTAARLSALARDVVRLLLPSAQAAIEQRHGRIDGAQFAVVGYGSLASDEMSFESDLDLIFVFDAPPAAVSNGQRRLAANAYFVRLAQRLMHLLTVSGVDGRLYNVDTRLRPNGRSGQLVSSINAFGRYQLEQAWLWEHQALIRSQAIAGDQALQAQFTQSRHRVLQQRREPSNVGNALCEMRAKVMVNNATKRANPRHRDGGLFDLHTAMAVPVLIEAPKFSPAASTQTLLQQMQDAALELRALASIDLPTDPSAAIARLRSLHGELQAAQLR